MLRFSLILILASLPLTHAFIIPATASLVMAEDPPKKDPPEEVVPPITPPTVIEDPERPGDHLAALRAQRKPA